jgi:NDP-sugar pyrophosphorylase family protein
MFSDTCVILVAGKGTRMNSEIPKPLIEVSGEPIIDHIVDFWEHKGVRRFIFVVGYRKELLIYHLDSLRLKYYNFVIQDEQKGIAHAIYQVKDLVSGKFIIALGDFIQVGGFEYPDNLDIGYSIWANHYAKYQNQGCSVRVNWRGYITGITEKADIKYAGIGTYFFDERVFPYIKNTQPSSLRNEVEISDVMQTMIRDGQPLKAVPFYGDCVNCTTPGDIEYAEQILGIGVK